MTNEQIQKLNEFKQKNKARVPAYAHKSEIIELRNSGYSFAQIQEYLLEMCQVKTSARTLSRIIANSEKVIQKKVAQDEPKSDKASAFFLKK
jgi:intein-encoded DNA endonuclease-like protein